MGRSTRCKGRTEGTPEGPCTQHTTYQEARLPWYVAKAGSKREQDMARRAQRGPQKEGGSAMPHKGWFIAGAALLVALLVWAAWPEEAAAGREANVAAFGLSDDPFMGDPDAPVVLVAYESPHCSSCKGFHERILPDLQTDFFDTGKVVYHYIQGTIGGDLESSIAQECAYEHGGNDAFWRLTDMFYARSHTYSTPDLPAWLEQVATEQGHDGQAMVACFEDRDTRGRVSSDWDIGRAFGARGTPSFWAFGPEGEAVQILGSNAVEQTLRDLLIAAAA